MNKNVGIRRTAVAVAVALCAVSAPSYAAIEAEQEKYIGEFSGFGMKIAANNYYFIKRTIAVFGTKWGASPTTETELEDRVWEQLLLSYEAFRRNITVTESELDEEIGKMLKSEKAAFDWKSDKQAYEKWVKEKTSEPVELFENQLRHLIQLENLRKQVLSSFSPAVTEKEAYQEFLNEYNTLELELVQFDEAKDAQGFYKKMQNPSLWEKEKKKNPKFAKYPGFVSLEFLINMWKIPKDDLYKMLSLDVNAIYPPIPIYRGYGVMRILKKRVAVEADFPPLRDSYFKQVEMIKKYDLLNEWLGKLKETAKIKVYPLGKG
jgi:hypothetical protein